MQKSIKPQLKPRKSPVQARSTASVDAILKATIQVLLRAGKEKLTTTRVAARAGVSVGTLYQYFPNKSALLRAALRLHVEEILAEVDRVCVAQRRQPVEQMAEAVRGICRRAAPRGIQVSLEFVPESGIPDLDRARPILQACNEPNCGLTLDLFHLAQSGGTVLRRHAGDTRGRPIFLGTPA